MQATVPSLPLLFVASDSREATPWVAQWDDSQAVSLPVHWARAGKWRGRDVLAVANGVGMQRAVAAIHAASTIADGFSGIFSIGTGGALDPSLNIADIVVANRVTDGNETWDAQVLPGARSGLVRTNSRIARTSDEKTILRASGAILVEMEASGVARIALELKVPFYCIRAVSDVANETFFVDFEEFLMPDGRFNVSRLAVYALMHPFTGLVELVRLQRRTSRAAERLGEYLSNCSF